MSTFFDLAARHLLTTLPPDALAEQLLLVPTRRAVVYLQAALRAALPAGQILRAPRILPLEDYVAELADATCCTDDELALQLRLFDTLKRHLPNLAFDDFAGWGPLLLRDFSLIDQELADPHQVFAYLADARALERWQLADEALGTEASAARRYLRFWRELEPVYHEFRQELARAGLAYAGMAYRAAVEAVQERLADDPASVPHHWFLGLGRLSAAERELIRLLRKAGKAEVRFDADDFYLHDSPSRAGRLFTGPGAPALPRAALGFGPDEDASAGGAPPDGPTNALLTRPRAVRALAVANPSVQGRVAGQLVADALQANPQATIAVVLPDETLLLPVLYGLPETVREFNVTMGLSFQATPLYSLLDLLFEVQLGGGGELRITNYELQKNGNGNSASTPNPQPPTPNPQYLIPNTQHPIPNTQHSTPNTQYPTPNNQQPKTNNQKPKTTYHHQTVVRLLGHPLLRAYERWLNTQSDQPRDLFAGIAQRITATNAVLVSPTQLDAWGHHHPLLQALFAPWGDASGAVASLEMLHDALRAVYAPQPAAMEGEYLLAFHQLIRHLARAFADRAEQPSVRAFRLFLNTQLRARRLPFEGHPIAQVQVMGWLETRALDFDHVIILSCNEGQLPAAKKHESLLPHDLLTEFNLPGYPEREADTAHQFWRLLQRAARVDLLYALPNGEGVRVGEPSRFLLQLEHDLVPRTGGRTTWRRQTVHLPSPERAPDAVLEKTPDVLAALRESLTNGLSPSALNDYLRCSLKFYYKRVGRLQATEEVEEDLGANHLGEAVHQVLQWLMTPFTDPREPRPITPDVVATWPAQVDALLTRAFAEAAAQSAALKRETTAEARQAPPDEGMNHLLRHVARQQLLRYLEHLQVEVATEPLFVLALETPREGTFFVDVPGLPEKLPVRLTGKVDRIDRLPGNAIRIVDYKTGKVEARDLKLAGSQKQPPPPAETLQKLLTDDGPGAEKVRQLWFYQLMQQQRDATLNQPERVVQTAIVSLRNLGGAYLSAPLDFLAEAKALPPREASEAAFGDLIRRLLDDTEPLRRTDNLDHCTRCDFRRVCAR